MKKGVLSLIITCDSYMKTNPNKKYNLRDMNQISSIPNVDGWLGCRKNGDLYRKRFRGGCLVIQGGPKLDKMLSKCPAWKAFEL